MNNKVIVIVGPTASGKSGLAIELAKKIESVVISADSMQIYKKLDVGTAKVTKEEAQGIKHELIDICNIEDNFDVSKYKELCYQKIDEILQEGKTPIVVGGTGLYINAVVNNIKFENVEKEKELEVKDQLEKLSLDKTTEELYEYLKSIDSDSAQKVDFNNRRRVLRAIELYLLGTSKTQSENNNSLWEDNGSKYNFSVFYIDMPRDLLYDRINKRVDGMVEAGVLEEAKMLYDKKEKGNTTVYQAIGYKEFFDFFAGLKPLEECVELLKINTRHYAKRQITWFKKFKNKCSIDGTKSKGELVNKILKEFYEN
ncbi:MAG: tRNA (adenosine(37)-N6)-dimethylallyltransferase MiaA [Clostridia bacterium]|nr:tRNA (adenosine(37)-N6)-dimethylallyltransferase MiaA [Clostridia bacterium]